MLTSYVFKGQELNDGVHFIIPWADQQLDDRNSVQSTWAYRKNNTPVQTGVQIREGVFTLNITVSPGATNAVWENKLDILRKLINTSDPAFYPLYRKLPHEATARYLDVAPREMTVNRKERRVSVTFTTSDKTWKNATEYNAQILLYETAARQEDLVITYNGLSPAEPRIMLEALTVGSEGPTPLYWRNVTVYSVGANSAGVVQGAPLKIVQGWNTSSLVSAGKMRYDGLDVMVALPDGTYLRRYINTDNPASRHIWVLPHTWPHLDAGTLIDGEGATSGSNSLLAGATTAYFAMYGTAPFPTSGTFMLDDEEIGYSGCVVTSSSGTGQYIKLTGLTRGLNGTANVDHKRFTPILRPVTLRVTYGYAAAYVNTSVWYNDLTGWPLINYDWSTNIRWYQTDTYDPNPAIRPWVWRPGPDTLGPRAGESVIAAPESDTRVALYGRYQSTNPNGSVRQRLNFPAPGYAGRTISYIGLTMTLVPGGEAYPGITVKLLKQSPHSVRELYSYTTTVPVVVNTGDIFTDARWWPATLYSLRLENAAPGEEIRNVRLDQMTLVLDYDYWNYYPKYTALSAEYGASGDQFPVSISIQNLNQPGGLPLTVNTQMGIGHTLTIDCGDRTATGINLTEMSYRNVTWMQLVPGTNTIRFTSPTGSGQVRATLYWKERF